MKPETKQKKKKLVKLDSTQKWSPIKDVKDGLVITKDGRYVQILEFAPINFLLLPAEEQEAIAQAFGSAMRIFPNKFQIKVLARKANVERHVANLHKHMDKERSPQCRLMQENSIRQIQKDAVNGISRRFFISFAYEEPPALRRPSWIDIRREMFLQSQQISMQLSAEPCNNELISPIGDSDHTLDILYNCLCRSEAELKPFEERIADVVCTHMVEHHMEAAQEMNIPVNDYICPRKIDPHAFTYLEVDNKNYAVGYIHRSSYPTKCVAGWLSALVNLGEGIDLDIFVEKKNTKEIMTQLTNAMKISGSSYLHKSNTSADLISLENKMNSQNYIRDCISNGQDFMYFSTMITVVEDSPDALKEKMRIVQNQLIAYGLQLSFCIGNHEAAFRSTLPINAPDKRILRNARRNICSASFGSAYPLTSYEINDPNGIMVGHNNQNYSPVFLDFFNRRLYNNGNCVFYGSSGAGKTYALQCLALRLRQYSTQVISVVPYKGHEYRPACEAIGGTFITLAPGSPHNINIMEIRKYDTSTREALDGKESLSSSILAAKIQQLHAFFSILRPEISNPEKRLLDEALMATYADFGITLKNKSLIDPQNPSCYKKMPILGDLYNRLKGFSGTSGLRDALARFISGSAKSFNAQTNVNLDNDYVIIDVSNMPKELMPIGIFIATDFTYDVIRADRLRKKAIILDELSRLIGPAGSPDAAEFVLTLYKTVRAYNTICVSATQDTNDFFALGDGQYGKGILANAKIKIIMKQEPEEIKTLSSVMHLSSSETRRIVHLQRGEGLLIANRNHAEIKFVASPVEHELITTDPEQLKEILARNASHTMRSR